MLGKYSNFKESIYSLISPLFPKGVSRKLNGTYIRFPLRVARFFPRDYEPRKHKFIEEKAFGIAVDGGAHIGYYSVLLARNCRKVIAFEPTETSRRILNKTLSFNEITNVEIRNEALGAEKGYYFFEEDDRNFASVSNKVTNSETKKRVNTISLDSLDIKIDFLKLDIEGSEILALKGATKVLSELRYLALEIHPSLIEQLGYSVQEIFEILDRHNPHYFLEGREVDSTFLNTQKDNFEINVVLDH